MTFVSADVLRGRGKELDAITTAVIGGTLLTGGYGSVVGTAIGALALGMAQIGIFFAGINADWYSAALGTLLLVVGRPEQLDPAPLRRHPLRGARR